jgi:hypothetical protein
VRTLSLLLLALCARPSSAAVSLTLNKDNTVRVTSAAIQGSNAAAFPGRRFYYIRASTEVFSATSVNGLDMTEEAGVRLSSLTVPTIDIAVTSITALSLLPLDGGGFRMAYAVQGTTGAFNVYTASSADGLAWANDTGTAIVGGTTFNGYPSLVELDSTVWAMFFVKDSAGGNAPSNYRIYRATSVNEGRNWGLAPATALFATQAGGVSATKLTDGRVRLWFNSIPTGGSSTTVVMSALSSDALATSFTLESGLRLSTSPGTVFSPYVERSTDAWRWRMYYDYSPIGISTGDAFSAVTDAPQPETISPSSVLANQDAAASTISGEIFSTGVTALLRQGAINLLGTGLVRTNDQSIMFTFDTEGQPTGFYDLIVTNSNGLSTTMTNAVFVDFPGGSVTMTDNLFRPRNGGAVRADVTIFNPGRVVAKLYTLEGRPLATLLDQEAAAGTLTVTWNGSTPNGVTVASGVYLLHVKGPKLNAINKIVVIK